LRILIVTMYYPPAAGAGVQRPLALAGHLPSLGVETHVLTPDDAKWVHRDDAQIEASRGIMGIDTQLIEDGTYFVVEIDGEIAGSGGWSRRRSASSRPAWGRGA
jgi:hypothetical protein